MTAKKEHKEAQELRNDVIAKMVGLEQRMSMQFGKSMKYNQTDYYKNLTTDEKKSFNNFVNTKNQGKVLVLFALALPLLLFGMMQTRLTGNVVYEATGVSSSLFGIVFISIFAVFLVLFLIHRYSKRFSERKLRGHVNEAVSRFKK